MKHVEKCNTIPEILIITPLKPGDKISIDTRRSVKRNKVPFVWLSYVGKGNPYKNTNIVYKQYRRLNGTVPKYVIKVDRDILAKKHWIDKMYSTLEQSNDDSVAYTYTKFNFTGAITASFDVPVFNADALKQNNYISSMSLIKTKLLDRVGGFVTDDRYFRLLDWALWLRFLNKGYIGCYTPNTQFTAYADINSISNGDNADYIEKRQLVMDDFINIV